MQCTLFEENVPLQFKRMLKHFPLSRKIFPTTTRALLRQLVVKDQHLTEICKIQRLLMGNVLIQCITHKDAFL